MTPPLLRRLGAPGEGAFQLQNQLDSKPTHGELRPRLEVEARRGAVPAKLGFQVPIPAPAIRPGLLVLAGATPAQLTASRLRVPPNSAKGTERDLRRPSTRGSTAYSKKPRVPEMVDLALTRRLSVHSIGRVIRADPAAPFPSDCARPPAGIACRPSERPIRNPLRACSNDPEKNAATIHRAARPSSDARMDHEGRSVLAHDPKSEKLPLCGGI